ncbi:MAG: T9SS type A sorting domain-containing protein [Chitinophagales bacterium]
MKEWRLHLTPTLPMPPYLFTIPIDSSGPYTTNGEFVRLAFPFIYPDATVPDTIILGFLSNDLNIMFNNTGEVAPENILELDNLFYTGTTQQIPNSGFEDWIIKSFDYPVSWVTTEMESASFDNVSGQVLKTTDARNGQYAVLIKDNARLPFARVLLAGATDPLIKPAFPVAHRFRGLYGYYKLTPDLNTTDTAVVYVAMYKDGQQIGSGTLNITNEASGYRPFYDSIAYSVDDSIQPDSANIGFYFMNRSANGNGNAVLYLDELSFDGLQDTAFVVSGMKNPEVSVQVLKIYPNPTAQFVAFTLPQSEHIQAIVCFDINGNIVKMTAIAHSFKDLYMFDVMDLQNAIYFLRIQTDNHVYAGKFLKFSN